MPAEHNQVGLDVVSDLADRRIREHGREHREGARALERPFTHEPLMSHRHVPRVARRRRQRDADEHRPNRRRAVEDQPDSQARQSSDLLDQSLQAVNRGHDRVVAHDGIRGWRKLADKGTEPECREQRVAPLAARTTKPERLRLERHADVGVNPHQLAALTGLVRVGLQALAVLLLRHFVGACEQLVERSVGRDQVARTLLPDAGHTLHVVDGVAHQGQDVHHLRGRHTELLGHARGIEPGALVARVVDADAVADQLEEVLVAGDDGHLEAGGSRLGRQRAQHIVGLEALGREDGHSHGLARLVHPGDLLAQIVGHRGAVGFVVGGQLRAERRGGEVERRGDVLGPMVREQLAEHGHEPVHGVGRLAIRAGQPADGVIRPVHLVAAVDQEQGARRHGHVKVSPRAAR